MDSQGTVRWARYLATGIFLVGLWSPASSAPLKIKLREYSLVKASIVKLSDVADVSGGTSDDRKRVSELDVLSFGDDQTTNSISRSLLSIRLQLAGFDMDDFFVEGALSAEVERSVERQLTDQMVLDVVRRPLLRIWNLSEGDLQIRLSRPISRASRQAISSISNWTIKPFVDNTITPGQIQIKFGVYERQQLVETFAVALEIHVYRSVAVAQRDFKRGDAIEPNEITVERRALEGREARDALSDVVGRKAARSIRAGQILTSKNTRSMTVSGSRESVTVKRRSVVQLVARKGSLVVRIPSAQALDEGKIGDMIRVKNLQSGKIITGRVANQREVEVAF